MLVYILFGVAIAFCIGADYLVNKTRREQDYPPRLISFSPPMVSLSLQQSGLTPVNVGKPTRNHRWTEKEKQFLVNNFKEISAKNIAKCKEMGGRHSVNAIYKMAARLGLSTSNPFNNKEHNELLTEKLRTESNQE